MRGRVFALAAALGMAVCALSPEAALANSSKVKIWAPTNKADVGRHLDAVDDGLAAPMIVMQQAVVTVVYPSRRDREIRRLFGHRYLGFVKEYSGPRYPF